MVSVMGTQLGNSKACRSHYIDFGLMRATGGGPKRGIDSDTDSEFVEDTHDEGMSRHRGCLDKQVQ